MSRQVILILFILITLYNCTHSVLPGDGLKSKKCNPSEKERQFTNPHALSFDTLLVKKFPDYTLSSSINNIIPVKLLSNSEYSDYKIFQLTKNSSIQYGDIKGIYPKMNIALYSYSNASMCSEAFNTWIKSIGDDDKIRISENKKYVKTAPVFSILTDRQIFVLYYQCEHEENNWEDVKSVFKDYFGIAPITIMNIECGGPLTWSLSE